MAIGGGLLRTLMLLVLAGAVFGTLWWTDSQPKESTRLVETLLKGRSMRSASRMVLTYDSTLQPIELSRQPNGRIRVTEPLVDDASVEFLAAMSKVYDTAVQRVITPKDEVTPEVLDRFELSPGNGRVRIEWPDGESVEVLFGGRGVFGDGVSALIDGAVWQVSAALLSTITANVDSVRSRRVFRTRLEELGRLTMTRRREDGTNEVTSFVRRGKGFRIDGEDDFDVDQPLLKRMLEAILLMPVDRFATGRVNVGARLATLKVEVESPLGREQLDVYLSDKLGMYCYAEPRNVEFFSERHRFEGVLAIPIEELRSRLLFPVSMLQSLDSVTIGQPARADGEAGEIFSLKKNQLEDFRIVSPMASTTNVTPVTELLGALRHLVAQKFFDDADDLSRFGLDQGYLTVRLHSSDPQYAGVELHIGARDGEISYIRRSDSGSVVAIANEVIDPLRRPWVDYVSRQVVRVRTPSVIRRLVCATAAGETVWERDETGVGWRVLGAPPQTPSDDDVADAFDAARDLVAKEVVLRSRLTPEQLVDPVRFRFEDLTGRALVKLHLYRDDAGRPWLGKPDGLVLYNAGATGKALLSIVPR